MWFAIAAIASSSDVMLSPFTLNIGAAIGLLTRSSRAIFAQFVCLANASLIADKFPNFCRDSKSLSSVRGPLEGYPLLDKLLYPGVLCNFCLGVFFGKIVAISANRLSKFSRLMRGVLLMLFSVASPAYIKISKAT